MANFSFIPLQSSQNVCFYLSIPMQYIHSVHLWTHWALVHT